VGEHFRLAVTAMLAGVTVILAVIVFLCIPPSDFPDKETVIIKPGIYLSQAADILYAHHIIRSPFLFKVLVLLSTGHRQIHAGSYLFEDPQSVIRVAYRTSRGIQEIPQVKITFSEGLTVRDIGTIIERNIPAFDLQSFLVTAKSYEGTLFPDTYFFYVNVTPAEVITLMHTTFTEKTKPALLDIQAFGKSADDVLRMASVVEREAASSTDRRIIAGILWKRLEIKMPLQVDASFYYLLGKASDSLTVTDLAVDSPYNLYKHTGLPPTPIDNPSLNAILDTVHPTKTKYWYFLSDRHGVTHYAETLEEHAANRQKYL
jgi:UPF0755 protein